MKRRLIKIDRRNERMIDLVVGADSDVQRIPVYNQILRHASPEFQRLVDSMEHDNTDLRILGVSVENMDTLIDYIYHTFEEGEASLPVTDENVHELSLAAHKFELDDVQSLCQDFFNSINICKENCIQLFVKTSESINIDFKNKCVKVLLSFLSQLFNSQAFINLTLAQLVYVIRGAGTESNCSEDLLCEAVVNWLKHRIRELNTTIVQLIDEFPDRKHKKQIIQTLHQSPDEEMKKFAFDLITDLYISGSQTMATTSTTTNSHNNEAANIDIKPNIVINESEAAAAAASTRPLKRPSNSTPDQEEAAFSCCEFEPKRIKTEPIDNDDAPISTTPEPLTGSFHGESSNSSGCKIYFVSRVSNLKSIYSLNLQNFEVERVPTALPQTLAALNSTCLQYYRGQIYFMGGMSRDPLVTNDVYIYNLEENLWVVKKIIQPRYGIQSVCFHNWIFVFGGWTRTESRKKGTFINQLEKLQLDTYNNEDWVEVVDNSIKIRNRCGLVVFKNLIYMIGGNKLVQGDEMEISGICETFNPLLSGQEAWKLHKAVLSPPRHGLLTLATEHEIYAIGGRVEAKEQQNRLRAVEILRENSDVWEVGPELIKPRAFFSGVYCKEQNAIFVFGGDCGKTPTCEKLDLETKTWFLVGADIIPGHTNYTSIAVQSGD